MLGPLQLVDHGDGVVLHRYPALALRVHEELISAQAELSGAFALLEVGGRAKKGPIQIRFLA